MFAEKSLPYIAPGSWLGILGGGQLGRMFTHAAQAMGYHVCVFDPDQESPAGNVADRHICASYDDEQALYTLHQLCASISTEFENIPARTLTLLESWDAFVTPSSHCIAIAQNRITEKAFISSCAQLTGIDVAPYLVIEKENDVANITTSFLPSILKTARLGYDGKGQININHIADIHSAWQKLHRAPCVLEQRLALAYEVSIVLARAHDGQQAHYPVVKNIHRDGILHTSVLPATNHIDSHLLTRIQHAAKIIAEQMKYIGVLCIEFFVLQDGNIVINEIAPRPHNSGHITMNTCHTNQFEQQVRVMTRLPLGKAESFLPGMMVNILGNVWFNAENDIACEPDWEKVCALPEVHLYLYGKRQARRERKMGHINLVANTADQVQQAYQRVCAILGLKA